MGKVNKNDLSWLTTVPASDINFKGHLALANIETVKAALKFKGLSKLAVSRMQSRIKELENLLNTKK